jgi:hypothetical protein
MTRTMTPFNTEKERLRAALAVARALQENPEHTAEFESGTTFMPIGVENHNTILVAVSPPEGRTADRLERVACAAG